MDEMDLENEGGLEGITIVLNKLKSSRSKMLKGKKKCEKCGASLLECSCHNSDEGGEYEDSEEGEE